MYNINSNEAKLDDLLNRMAHNLQLDETRREKMISAYKAVSDWIDSDEGFFKDVNFEIYPHGSAKIGTTVKPRETEEFDLDFVIHIELDWEEHDPFEVYEELKRRLNEHGTYKQMLEPKNRVLRLNYAGDFHIDIMPGCQEFTADPNKIKIRDKKERNWVSSNPRGYAEWFEAKADTVEEFLLEKALSMEEIPDEEPYELKKPLKRAVQLIKRHRDIYFEKDVENSTASIILTTLAGIHYKGEGTIYETVNNIITKIHYSLGQGIDNFTVVNPVNTEEEFTNKWKESPILFNRFVEFIRDFKASWERLKRENGIDDSSDSMKVLFGTKTFDKAFSEQSDHFEKAVKNSSENRFVHTQTNEYEGLKDIAQKSKPFAK